MHVCIMHVNKLEKWTSKVGVHPSYIHIVLSIVNQSCISSFHYTHMNAQLNAHTAHTHKRHIHTKAEIQKLCLKGLNRELLSALPSSSATYCLHSRALRASPGINDHYGSIRAATRRSLCYTEKLGMKMLVGSHQGRDADWVRERHNTQSSSYSRCHHRQTAIQVQWVSLLSSKRTEGKDD